MFIASYGLKKQREKATGNRETAAHYCDRKQFKGFTKERVRNYDQRKFGKLNNGVAWNSSLCGRFLAGRSAAPSTV